MKGKLRKGIALALTVALVVTTLSFTAGNMMRASDDEEAYKTEQNVSEQAASEPAAVQKQDVDVAENSSDEADDSVNGKNGNTLGKDKDKDKNVPGKNKPKASFSKKADNGMKVAVEAPEGALEDNTAMSVSSLNRNDALAYAKKVDEDVVDAAGVTIKFTNKNDNVEPDKSVSVTLSGVKVKGETFKIMHVRDNGSVEAVDGFASASSASFSTSEFSSYIIAGVSESDSAAAGSGESKADEDNSGDSSEEAGADDEESDQKAPALTKSVSITYDANGGDGTSIVQKVVLGTDGKGITSLTNNTFTKSGYTFAGWSTDKKASSGLEAGSQITVTEDVTYYAVWTKELSFFESIFGQSSSSSNYAITASKSQIKVGETLTLNGTEGYSSSWTSSDSSVASVSGRGNTATVTGVGAGTVTITHKYYKNYSQKTETYQITVTSTAAAATPTLSLSKSSVSLTTKGSTSTITATVGNAPEEYIITWESSNEGVATVENGVVTAVGAGSATITANLNYYDANDEMQVISKTASVKVTFSSYSLYYYALIPGASDSGTSSADSRWYGLGLAQISGAPNPSSLSYGVHDEVEYTVTSITKALYPNLTYNGVTYKYAEAGSENAYSEGYYTVLPYRLVVADGANAGNNNYNGTASGKTYHLDHTISLNEKSYKTVTFNVQYPETSSFASLTNYAQRVKHGTSESKINKPTSEDVPQTQTKNGITYEFDGWYKDEACTEKADFSGTIEQNTNYFGKYVATTQRYTVEYYYDNVKDSSLTYTSDPVKVGSEITTYPEKNKTGFNLSNATVSESNPLVVSSNAADNVIKVYYVKRTVGYTVNYYLNGTTTKVADSVTGDAKYGDTVSGSLKDIEGYTPVEPDVDSKSLVVSEDSKEINFYYYKNVTLTANSKTETYTGQTQSVSGYTVNAEGTIEFEGLSIGATGTNAGVYTADASSAMGKVDKSEKYKVTDTKNGSLTINKAVLTVTTPSAAKEFDGNPLTAEGTIEGLVDGETVTFTTTGTQTEIGNSSNTYTLEFNGSAKEENYTVSASAGTLTVTSKKVDTIVVSVDNTTAVYDGKAHGANVSVSNLPDGWTVSDKKASGTAAHVADGTVTAYCSDITIKNENGTVVFKKVNGEVTVNKLSSKTEAEAVTFTSGSVKITPRTLTVSTPDASKVYNGMPLTSAGSVSGLVNNEEVSFATTGTRTEVGSSANTYTLAFDKSAVSTDYTVSEDVGTLTVTEYADEITITTVGGTYTYDGSARGATVSVSTLPEGYTLATATSSATATDVGTVTADCDTLVIRNVAGVDVTNRLNIDKVPGSIIIQPASLTVTTESASKVYNGKPLTAGGRIEGFVNNETAELVLTGSQTDVGSSSNTYQINWNGSAKKSNYRIAAENIGTLTVTESNAVITVTTTGGTFTYDGQSHGASVAVSNLPEGYTLSKAVSNDKVKDVSDGTVTANCDELIIVNAKGEDVTSKLKNIVYVDGTLEITPATVTITTESSSKVYDGTPLQAAGSMDGLVNGETATFAVTGSQTAVGNSKNTYSLDWGSTNSGNYTISESIGTLTVTEYAGEITVTTTGGSFTYDGNAHNAAVSVSTLPKGYSVETAASNDSATHVADGTVAANCDTLVIKNAQNVDVTSKLNIKYVDGSITITPAALTVTTPNASKVYDSDPLTAEGSISGFVKEESATFTTTGTQTEVGSSDNTYNIAWDKTAVASDYTVNAIVGKLTVTENTDEIVVTTTGGEFTYDGNAHGATVSVSTLPKGYTLETAVSNDTATHVSEGTVAANCDTLVIKNAKGVDVTSKLNIRYVDGSIKINPATLTVTTPDASKVYDGDPLTAEGTITGFVNGETATFKTTGSQTEVDSSDNTYSITWDKTAKESNYIVAATVGTLTVTEYAEEITVTTTGGSFEYDGQAHGATVRVSTLPKGYTLGAAASNDTATHVADGTVTADCDTLVIRNAEGEDVTSRLNLKYVNGTITIIPATITVVTDTLSKVYDSDPLTGTGRFSGLKNGETFSFQVTGTITEPGSVANSYSITWDKTAVETDYTVSATIGTLTVTESTDEIVVTTTGFTGTYDGEEHAASVNVSNLPKGYRVETAESYDKATDVTTTDITANCDKLVIRNAKGTDVTSKLNIRYANSIIKINPATLTVTTPSASKVYDGTALTAAGTIDGFVNGETATFATTGTQTAVDSSENTYSITWDKTAKEGNYIINETVGTLEVTEYAGEITVTTTGGTFTYDGNAHGATVSVSTLPTGYTLVSAASDDTATDVTKTDVTANCDNLVIKNAQNVDVTKRLNIKRVDGSIAITPATLTVVTESASKVYDGDPLTAGGSIEGFVNDENATFTVTGSQTEADSSQNTYSITWDGSAKKDNYVISESIGTLTVTENADEIVVTTTGGEFTYDGQAHGATVSVSTLPKGYTLETATSDATATHVKDGTVTAACDTLVIKNARDVDVTSKLNIRYVDGSIKINPATLTVTTPDATKVYDGEPLTAAGSITGFVNGETATFTTTGTQTAVDSSDNTYKIDWTGSAAASDYTISENIGTLTVTEYAGEITVTTTGGEFTYDGQAHGAKVSVSTLPKGYTLETATSADTATHVAEGTVTANCDTLVIRNAQNVDVTSKLNINYVDGSITITPAPLTITTGSASKQYDGIKLTSDEVTASGLVGEESVRIETTGSRLFKGTSSNTYSIKWAGEDSGATAFKSDYAVTDELGTLEITPKTEKLTITAGSDSKMYDGTPLTSDKFTYTENILVEGDELTAVTDGTITDAGTADNVIKSYKVMHGDRDVTENYTFNESVKGKLEVTKRTVILTSESDSKVYDKTPLTNGTVNITGDGFITGEGAEYTVTGTRTEVGESDNAFAYSLNERTKDGNYNIIQVIGKLEVMEREGIVVYIEGHTDSATYDSNEHSVSGYNVTGIALVQGDESKATDLYTESDFTFKGDASARGTDAGTYPMNLSEEQFENTNKNFKNVTFVVVDGKLVINPVTDKVIVTVAGNSKDVTYDGNAHKVEGYSVDISNELYPESGIKFTGTASAEGTDVNTYMMGLAEEQFENISKNFTNVEFVVNDGQLKINPLEGVVVTIAENGKTATYDGNMHKVDGYKVKSIKVGTEDTALYKEADFKFNGTAHVEGIDVDTYDMEVNEGDFENINGNFKDVEFVVEDNVLKIVPKETQIVITAKSKSKLYDGKPLTANDFTYTDGVLVKGEVLTAVIEGEITDAGSADNVVKSFKVTKADGTTDSTGNYTFAPVVNGTLTVNPRTVIMTSASDSKTYDTKPLTNDTVTEGGDGFIEGEGAVYTVKGSQTEKGFSSNEFTYELKDGTKAGNYSIEQKFGKLTVAAKGEVVVTIAEHSDRVRQDGEVHVLEGYDVVSISDPLYTEDDFEFEGESLIAESEPGVYDMNIKAENFTNINENFDNVTFVIIDGQLIIDRVYTLTIHYVNEAGEHVANDYYGKLIEGESFRVQSPAVEGYTPSYRVIASSPKGMPAMDLEYTVVYTQNQIMAPVVTPNNPGGNIPAAIVDDNGNLQTIDDNQVPLAPVDLYECILHLLIMIAALLIFLWYMRDTRKLQIRVLNLEKELEE